MCELCGAIARVVDQIQDFLPRCEQTGKVMFEIASSGIIAEQMSRRSSKDWKPIHCEACGKMHMSEDGIDTAWRRK